MHIAICGPISLKLLEKFVAQGDELPEGYRYPFAAYLAKEYMKAGHRVSIVTSVDGISETCQWKGEQCTIIVTPRRVHARDLIQDFYRCEVDSMASALKQLAPDIVHAQWTYEFADAALTTGLPTLVTARDSPWRIAWISRHPYRWLRACYSFFYVLPRVKHLTVLSNYLAHELLWLHGYWRKISVIPNGIALGRFSESPTFGLKHRDVIKIYCVSEWGRRKNVKTLLKAFALIRKIMPHVELELIGGGLGEKENGYCWACQKNLIDGVFFRGYQEPDLIMRELRTVADLFVSPTLEESLGMIFVEAMSQGVACMGGLMSGAVPWVLDNKNAGFLANVKKPEQLAASMIKVLNEPACIAHIAECGFQRAKDVFALEVVARRYVDEFERVLSKV